jgi:hypothetical protein
MSNIICKDPLKSFSQSLVLSQPIRVQDLPKLLKIPDELAEAVIVVRNHQKLDLDEFINNDDELYLFLAVMGG